MDWLGNIVRQVGNERSGYGYDSASHLKAPEHLAVWGRVFHQGVRALAWSLFEIARSVKSPLEEVFAVTLFAALLEGETTVLLESPTSGPGLSLLHSGREPKDELTIATQVPVEKYVADFVVTWRRWGLVSSVAVEIDGHDFHEKTKAQAAHDKKRDRAFTKNGVKLFRFTGSEIHNNAAACAKEVLDFLGDEHLDEIDRLSEANKAEAKK